MRLLHADLGAKKDISLTTTTIRLVLPGPQQCGGVKRTGLDACALLGFDIVDTNEAHDKCAFWTPAR
jgi:hypothetical protein